ncbi:MAG: ketopantoate reductase family protein [Bacteroidales bacterium]|nr:ketopantoate reductase family protein [Bacteroidales bacterium]
MRAVIYGAGSLGTILGAFITKNGGQIDLVNRNREHTAALKANGATVTGTLNFNQKVSALSPEEMSGKYDIIFLMTKQQDNRNTVTFLKDYLEDDGVLVTLQNGLPEVLIGSILGEERVLGCTVAWGATRIGPGVSELTSEPDSLTFSLGSISEDPSPRINEVKALLEMMGPVHLDDNFVGNRWSKLLINAAFSGMSAVLGCTFGETVEKIPRRKVVQAIMKECMDVCKAGGIKIEPVQGKDIVKLFNYNNPVKKFISLLLLPFAIRKHRMLKASMLQDLEHGKKTEVDSINGSVCAFGRKVGCPTPVNDKVVEIIHRIEAGELTPSFKNLELFKF